MPESTEMMQTQKTLKSVDATMIFRECDIRNKQRAFHNKGVKITDRGDEKASALVRFSHRRVCARIRR